jgi:CO/xanthine dehydrogenase Mo-binding subunit
MVLDYIEEFMAANPRHSTVIKLKTGVKQDGTITAHLVDVYCNSGAYCGYKPYGVIGQAIIAAAAGPYRIDNVRLQSREIYARSIRTRCPAATCAPQGSRRASSLSSLTSMRSRAGWVWSLSSFASAT